MQTKRCSIKLCSHKGVEQPISNFIKYNRSKDGLSYECNDCRKDYKKRNRDKINNQDKHYRQNTEKGREVQKKISNKQWIRYSTEPEYKLKILLRRRLSSALRAQGVKKTKTVFELSGCSLEFLKAYIAERFQEDMSWDNYGEWEIDHKIPCSFFNLLNIDEQKQCFHYTNLQPLWRTDNRKKSDKIL